MLRSLLYFWRMNLVVAAGAAVATAVLGGALVVGDSIRGSLAERTRGRLGAVDLALVAEHLFPDDLAARLAAHPDFDAGFGTAVPALLLRGSAEDPATGSRASRVAVAGVDGRFAGLFPDGEALDLKRLPGQIFPPVVLNRALARELGVEAGDAVLLSFERAGEVPRETLLGRSAVEDVLDTLRLTVAAVLPPDSGVGGFGLAPRQSAPLSAFVSLPVLRRALGRPQEANALLVASRRPEGGPPEAPGELGRMVSEVLAPEDLGLTLRRGPGYLAVESRELLLRPAVVAAVTRAAEAEGAPVLPLLTYLANRMTVGERSVPYSTVTALPAPPPEGFGPLVTAAGEPAPALAEGETLLGAWAARELTASPGDRLTLSFYEVGPRGELSTREKSFRVAAVAAREGLAADPTLTPEVPGVSDADDMAGWDPPFPVDLGAIRPEDEEYWDLYRGTPKAFVSLADGRRLWASRFGDLTALRVALPEGEAGEVLAASFRRRLAAGLPPPGSFEPVKAHGLAAAAGSTDFTGLFLGFSLFLIASSALLVGLLFRLAVERRGAELGLRLAVGTPARKVLRGLLAEAAVVAAAGAAAGTGLAVAYAGAVLSALATWWAPLLGSGEAPLLALHLEPATLAGGFAASLALVLATVAVSVRRLVRLPARALLAGALDEAGEQADRPRRGRGARRLLVAALALAAVLVAAAAGLGADSAPALFFAAGAALLTAGLAAFALWCRGGEGGAGGLPASGGTLAVAAMAARNSARNPGRSLLSVALVACACFVLVSVTANRKEVHGHDPDRASGSGGFTLMAEADVPLYQDLGSPEGRSELGFSEEDEALLSEVRVMPLRLLPGEDASCLNLYRPERPRVLGVPPEFVARGGFTFRDTLEEAENPWTLLERPLPGGAVPAVGDYNSLQWILKKGLGDEVLMPGSAGEPVRLVIVGRLATSLFQSELLIAEEAFLRHFPDRGGDGAFLVEVAPEAAGEVSAALERSLARFGFDATATRDRLAEFEAVENMYLATFEALGGLGLLLGTLGLGVVLARNVLERRRELAAMRAFGFRRRVLSWLVAAENAFLLAVGVAVGAAAGLAAVAPHLISGGARVPWGSLSATLGLVFAAGMLASAAAVAAALRVPLLPALKAE